MQQYSFFHSRISIHAPLAGCDASSISSSAVSRDFNPRTPCGVRRRADPSAYRAWYFNPRTPCGVRRRHLPRGRKTAYFNPRTPCGVRLMGTTDQGWYRIISIHAPLAGCDLHIGPFTVTIIVFQSTHPLRGATICKVLIVMLYRYFNPRTPCGVRLIIRQCCGGLMHFNPRTPCGVRLVSCASSINSSDFNPRTPCGVRHWPVLLQHMAAGISIHAPLAGCDPSAGASRRGQKISIHAPLAGCDSISALMEASFSIFQSTHPLRGAT